MTESRSNRVCRLIFHSAPLTLAATLLVVSVGINLANVVARYIFKNAFYWAEEAMIYMAIWSIFLAAVAIAYDGRELTMDMFSNKLGSPWKRLAEGAMAGFICAVCLFMSWQSWKLAGTLMRNAQNSLALEIPMWIPQSSLLLGFVMIAGARIARFLCRHDEQGNPQAQETVV